MRNGRSKQKEIASDLLGLDLVLLLIHGSINITRGAKREVDVEVSELNLERVRHPMDGPLAKISDGRGRAALS